MPVQMMDDRQQSFDEGHPPPALGRPYSRTGGRTWPVRDLEIEALVVTRGEGIDTSTLPLLSPEHASVIELSRGTVSVAEVAVGLGVPIGVARVIIADKVELGLVEVLGTSSSTGDNAIRILERVLSGLQRSEGRPTRSTKTSFLGVRSRKDHVRRSFSEIVPCGPKR
jgi:hypothetical protein